MQNRDRHETHEARPSQRLIKNLLACLTLALAPAPSLMAQATGIDGQADVTPGGDITDSMTFEIGPIEGISIGWHKAPATLTLPAGTALEFRFSWDADHELRWFGAAELYADATSSTAGTTLVDGAQTVQVRILDGAGVFVDIKETMLVGKPQRDIDMDLDDPEILYLVPAGSGDSLLSMGNQGLDVDLDGPKVQHQGAERPDALTLGGQGVDLGLDDKPAARHNTPQRPMGMTLGGQDVDLGLDDKPAARHGTPQRPMGMTLGGQDVDLGLDDKPAARHNTPQRPMGMTLGGQDVDLGLDDKPAARHSTPQRPMGMTLGGQDVDLGLDDKPAARHGTPQRPMGMTLGGQDVDLGLDDKPAARHGTPQRPMAMTLGGQDVDLGLDDKPAARHGTPQRPMAMTLGGQGVDLGLDDKPAARHSTPQRPMGMTLGGQGVDLGLDDKPAARHSTPQRPMGMTLGGQGVDLGLDDKPAARHGTPQRPMAMTLGGQDVDLGAEHPLKKRLQSPTGRPAQQLSLTLGDQDLIVDVEHPMAQRTRFLKPGDAVLFSIAGDPGAAFEWRVDGKPAHLGHDFVRVFVDPGTYLVSVGPLGAEKDVRVHVGTGDDRPTVGDLLDDGQIVRSTTSDQGGFNVPFGLPAANLDAVDGWVGADGTVSVAYRIQNLSDVKQSYRVSYELVTGPNGTTIESPTNDLELDGGESRYVIDDVDVPEILDVLQLGLRVRTSWPVIGADRITEGTVDTETVLIAGTP